MSMLSEPSKMHKWFINPRGMGWVNDEEKFGQKLMEKMGWSKGKGLGREEQGNVDNVVIHMKNNTRGMGYKVTDDQWIQHYEGFESVLACLNEQNCEAIHPKSEEEKVSNRTSLEALSKTSRARVHYHKFTRGKDLSRLNTDEIGCITGSKRAKKLAKVKKSDTFVEEEVGQSQHDNGLTTIKGGNIQDYFAKKMAALKGRTNRNQDMSNTSQDDHKDQSAVNPIKKEKKKKKFSSETEEDKNDNAENIDHESTNSSNVAVDNSLVDDENILVTNELPTKTNKKKSKRRDNSNEKIDAEYQEVLEKKRKKKKSKDRADLEENNITSCIVEEPPKKKEKRSK